MDACCNDIIGGEVIIHATFTNGTPMQTYEGMGDIRIQPSMMERTAGASSGGTVWVTEQRRPARAILNFANRCKADPMLLFKGRCKLQVTIIERGRGIQHDFRDAIAVGLPEINLTNGEITGMEVAGYYEGPGSYSTNGAATGGQDVTTGFNPAVFA